MADTIKTGTILIQEGTLLPEAVRLESEPCVPGWRLVKDLDACGLDRKIYEAGWTFFCLAGEPRATVFGIDEEKMVRKAIKEILGRLKLEKFNSLEITRVTSVASKRFLEVRYVTVFAQSRLIQQGVGLVPAKDFALRMPVAPESRPVNTKEQQHGESATKRSADLISSSRENSQEI